METSVTGTTTDLIIAAVASLIAIVGIVVFVVWIRQCKRQAQNDPAKCSQHVVGKVIGGGTASYGGNLVPLCSFEVDGVEHRVEGPLFEYANTAPGLACNCTSRENLPAYFSGPSVVEYGASVLSNDELFANSCLARLYPMGSDVDIYYEPGNPGNAYVQRPIKGGYATGALLAASLMMVGVGLFFLLGPVLQG